MSICTTSLTKTNSSCVVCTYTKWRVGISHTKANAFRVIAGWSGVNGKAVFRAIQVGITQIEVGWCVRTAGSCYVACISNKSDIVTLSEQLYQKLALATPKGGLYLCDTAQVTYIKKTECTSVHSCKRLDRHLNIRLWLEGSSQWRSGFGTVEHIVFIQSQIMNQFIGVGICHIELSACIYCCYLAMTLPPSFCREFTHPIC